MEEPKRILVVDDTEDDRSALAELLRVWGHYAEAAGPGKRALQKALAQHPDAVVVDLALVNGDALDVIRRIRAQDSTVVIVGFSAGGGRGGRRTPCGRRCTHADGRLRAARNFA